MSRILTSLNESFYEYGRTDKWTYIQFRYLHLEEAALFVQILENEEHFLWNLFAFILTCMGIVIQIVTAGIKRSSLLAVIATFFGGVNRRQCAGLVHF